MSALFHAFFPIISLIVVGYILTKLKVLSSNTEKVLLEITFNLSIPALIFLAVMSEPIDFIEIESQEIPCGQGFNRAANNSCK